MIASIERRVGEEIVVGDIIIQLVRCKGSRRVTLKVSAPEGVRVDRREIHELNKFTRGRTDATETRSN